MAKDLFSKAGNPVELSPWAYEWRRDREIQEKPEAYFIPRRLERMDKVYRTAADALSFDELKSIFYKQDDIITPLLPAPENPLLCGLLWVGGLTDYIVTLVWNDSITPPAPGDVEVRTFPTAWGWFGWSVDKRLENPVISADGKRWSYTPPEQTMDMAYNSRVKAATELIAVFAGEDCPVPKIEITGASLGEWKPLTFVMEWGLNGIDADYDGKFLTHIAEAELRTVDKASKRAVFDCIYTADGRFGCDGKFTAVFDEANSAGCTVLLRELAETPIYIPEYGVYMCAADCGVSADEYISSTEAAGKASIRERVRAVPEHTDWEDVIRNTRFWSCPPGTEIVDFAEVRAPEVEISVPDKHWEDMYRHSVEQLRGPMMWGMLSAEVSRATEAMEMLGLREDADRVYDYFLSSPGIKSDGDFTDPAGSLEWAKGMRHDIGYSHEGTHSSTGAMIYSMSQRYRLYADREWLDARLGRIKAAAKWIISERRGYMSNIPNRDKLHVAGLMPPSMLGDYALPACDWHWYYVDNATQSLGLTAFAEVLRDIKDPDADYFTREANEYKADINKIVAREAMLAPVRRASDGSSYSFIPRMAYCGGLLHYGKETNIPQFAMGINDLYQGALMLAMPDGPVSPTKDIVIGLVNGMEEAGAKTSIAEFNGIKHPTADMKTESADDALQTNKTFAGDWFWNVFSNLPKVSYNANIYLRQDDIPNFLRFFFNHAVMMVGSDGGLWEHAHPASFEPCTAPDNGTAGWFGETFRSMLVTEDSGVLWLAKGTPRAWLAQGKRISVTSAPTLYGMLSYSIESDTDNGVINAVIDAPDRKTVPSLKLRLRHPDGAKISSVTVNGKKSGTIDADGETVTFTAPTGKLIVSASYK